MAAAWLILAAFLAITLIGHATGWLPRSLVDCATAWLAVGTLMAFGTRRLWHRMACAVEDAGWELVDQIAWMFDDGMDTSETAPHALDREAGVDVKEGRVRLADGPAGTYARRVRYRDRYQAKTDGARAWEGFSSGLRPCWEPVLVARAP